jgi:FemAB-related protein (PEP-CTERM system-associated)
MISAIAAVEPGDAWDNFVLAHPAGSPFHLSHWQRLITKSFPHKPKHLVAVAPGSGNTILGVLPLFLVRSRIFGSMIVSTPQAAYGGPLGTSPEVCAALLDEAKKMAQKEHVGFLEMRSFRNESEDQTLVRKDLYVTFRQELCADTEKQMLAIPRKTRAEIREGLRNGLEFKADGIGVDEFYAVYSRSVRDLGTPVFSRRLFANGLREFGKNCRIFSVHFEGKPVAAVWTLFYKDEIVPYYGGSIREYNRLAVNNFMYWMLIKFACENGYRVFDFGRSKKGTGSFDFKKRWGMTMTDLPYEYFLVGRESMPDTSPLNPKFALMVRTWQKLPLPVANSIGPLISRHLI